MDTLMQSRFHCITIYPAFGNTHFQIDKITGQTSSRLFVSIFFQQKNHSEVRPKNTEKRGESSLDHSSLNVLTKCISLISYTNQEHRISQYKQNKVLLNKKYINTFFELELGAVYRKKKQVS